MDQIKSKIEKVVRKVKEDKDFAASFQEDPVKAVGSLIGFDISDEMIKSVIDGAKALLAADKAQGSFGKVKGLFRK